MATTHMHPPMVAYLQTGAARQLDKEVRCCVSRASCVSTSGHGGAQPSSRAGLKALLQSLKGAWTPHLHGWRTSRSASLA